MNAEILALWPTAENVTACIKHEAETVDDAVFLAVHQPMAFRRLDVGAGQAEGDQKSEQHLLDEFMTAQLPEGRLILPIVGSSGVGKSHVIRWIDAQLRGRADRDRRHIIRIPKGMSLKGVLRLLLKDLDGPAYDRLREALMGAREQLEPRLAARHLLLNLRHRLEQESAAAALRIREGRAQPDDKRLKDYGDPQALPMLLGDSALEADHWLSRSDGRPGVITQIAEHVTERAVGEEDTRKHEFTREDLVLPDALVESLNRNSQRFYRSLMGTARSDRVAEAVSVLNRVLDAAKQDLLQLGESLTDLFRDVRAQLHKDGKELVLLVEDFAVLSGMQGALLQVMITEAYRDGEQVLCTMRSALAYTEGYANVPETVLTRARSRWLIEDVPGDEARIIDRVCRLVGAYLNAARLGQQTLRERAEGGNSEIPVAGLEGIEDENRVVLDAFGHSEDGYPLFPFNRGAIRQLCLQGSVRANRMVFNPRNVINNVLGKVLPHRDLFARGQFPPPELGRERLRSHEVIHAAERRVPRADQERYYRLLALWGDQPTVPAEAAALPGGVYAAFGLIRPNWDVKPVPNRDVKPVGTDRAAKPGANFGTDTAQPDAAPVNPKERRWRDTLEAWAGGETLPQREARELRGFIAAALLEWIPWNGLLHNTQYDSQDLTSHVYLPNAQGQGTISREQSMVVAFADESLRDTTSAAQVVRTLMAFVRLHEIHQSWTYAEAEQDHALYTAFLERLAEATQLWLRARYFHLTEADTVPALAEALVIGAKALGIDGADSNRLGRRIDALFAEATAPVETPSSEWERILQRISETRPELRILLLDQVGARQGDGAKVLAVDAARLEAPIRQAAESSRLTTRLPTMDRARKTEKLHALVNRHNEMIGTLPLVLRRERIELLKWREQAIVWFGEDPDKPTLQSIMRDTITQAKTHLPRNYDYDALRRRVTALSDLSLKATLSDCARLANNDAVGEVISVLARRPGRVVRTTQELVKEFDYFLDMYEREVNARIQALGEDALHDQAKAIRMELDALGELLARVGGAQS
jgi:hypothetical protein